MDETGTRSYTPAGERILAVATRVFYAEGIRVTGVDRIAALAEVTKPTLYAQFGSKEALIAAVLERRSQRRQEALTQMLQAHPGSPRDRLLAIFDWLADGHQQDGFRGCPFTNAAVELPDPGHPARAVISAYKRWLRQTLTGLARLAGDPDPDGTGHALLLLIDGANARVVTDGDRGAMRKAGTAAAKLIGADGTGQKSGQE